MHVRAGARPKRGGADPSALELVERFGAQMLSHARRYSLNAEDAEDAYQRAAEILLRTRPTGNDDQVRRWLKTTVRREALAVRARRTPVSDAGEVPDVPDRGGDASEQAERFELLRLGVEALGRLKPQEVRCLVLRAQGFSYREICSETGWTYTKVNRCITEGRRAFVRGVEELRSGAECDRLAPALSALADGEAGGGEVRALRPHLASCATCRARLREFRALPARVAAVVPPAALAAGPGPLRGALEQALGAAHARIAAFGDRAHAATELATGGKVAAVAASAAALAGGGAATVSRIEEAANPPRRPAAQRNDHRVATSQSPPPPVLTAPASRSPAHEPAAPAPAPASAPPPPAPAPESEFTPEAATAAPAPRPPSGSAGGGLGPGGGSGAGGRGGAGGEFAP